MSENEAPADTPEVIPEVEPPVGSPEVIPVADLLEPISADKPCGENLREDSSPNSAYYQVKDARNGARAAERSADRAGADRWTESKELWLEVLKLAPDILAKRTKDLEVAAWATEALVRRHGFVGLRDGFRLIQGLVERYAADIYPTPDYAEGEGEEERVAPLTGLNGEGSEGTLLMPIASVPLTADTSTGAFSAWQHRDAQEVDRITDADKKQRRIEGGAPLLADVNTALSETPPGFHLALRTDLDACIDLWAALSTKMDAIWGRASPPTSAIRRTLTDYRDTLNLVAANVFASADAAAEADAEADEEAGEAAGAEGGTTKPKRSAGSLETREDALRMLAKVAEYFRRTEPHSPLSYATNQVVRWGRMSLPELLSELIPEASARENLFKLTGMDASSGDPS